MDTECLVSNLLFLCNIFPQFQNQKPKSRMIQNVSFCEKEHHQILSNFFFDSKHVEINLDVFTLFTSLQDGDNL